MNLELVNKEFQSPILKLMLNNLLYLPVSSCKHLTYLLSAAEL